MVAAAFTTHSLSGFGSIADLARVLGTSPGYLKWLAFSADKQHFYTAFQIKKRRGGTRPIWSPNGKLKEMQSRLAAVLQQIYPAKQCVHGYIKGRGIKSNAEAHTCRRWILNIDIDNFFGSIHFGRVLGALQARPLALSRSVSQLIASLCTYRGVLPQGAPTSPVLSNIVCRGLDSKLQRIAGTHRCTYTRYSDDITISTDRTQFPIELATTSFSGCALSPTFVEFFRASGFGLNLRKSRLVGRGRRRIVTGLTVNDSVAVPTKHWNELRFYIHVANSFGVQAALARLSAEYSKHRNPSRAPLGNKALLSILVGKVSFLRHVHGARDEARYERMLAAFSDAFNNATVRAWHTETVERQRSLEQSIVVLECRCSNDCLCCTQGTAFYVLGVGWVTAAHVVSGCRNMRAFSPKDYARTPSAAVFVDKIDHENDVALLDIPGIGTRPALSPSPRHARELLSVVALGYPSFKDGDRLFRFSGHVVGQRRRRGAMSRTVVTAPIYAGMSGGPVLDQDGRVLGVAVTGQETQTSEASENHAFAPLRAVLDLV